MILKYTVANGKSYIDILPDLIDNYNSSYHRTIDGEPDDIWNGKTTNNQNIHRIETTFKVGDKVRHLVDKSTFDKKSSTSTYTKTIYTITKKEGNSLYLDDLKKPYREFELIKAVGDNMNTEYDDKAKEDNRQARIQRRLRREGI